MEAKILKRVFMSNGNALTDPDPSMSPAAVKDLFSAMYPELLNAEIQGPVVTADEVVFTFHRTTGTKGHAKQASAMSSMTGAQASFMQRLEIAASEATKSSNLPATKVASLRGMLTPRSGDQALRLATLSCPLLV